MTDLSYSHLQLLDTFEARLDYLCLYSKVGDRTFGGERWMNQDFYRSYEWKRVRQQVIARDLGCDLGVEGFDIFDKPIIHHMNPMNRDQISMGDPTILDPEFLITVTHETHNAIHFGSRSRVPGPMVERRPGDTRLW